VESETPQGPHLPSPGEYQKVHERARRDPLTGLLNTVEFRKGVEQRIAEALRGKAKPALILMDLDEFKRINDTHGHEAGDEVIKTIAATLRHNETDTPDFGGRLGGDEFGFLVDLFSRSGTEQTDEEKLAIIAERIRESFAVFAQTDKVAGLEPSFSMGLAVWTPGMEARDLLELADTEMYKQKSAGRTETGLEQEPAKS
jgi:diguanylate cyclase (GGDEF)-like protein